MHTKRGQKQILARTTPLWRRPRRGKLPLCVAAIDLRPSRAQLPHRQLACLAMGFHLVQRLLMVGPFLSQRRHLLRNAPIFRYMGCFSVFVLGGHGVVVSAGSPEFSVNFLPPAPPFTVRPSQIGRASCRERMCKYV